MDTADTHSRPVVCDAGPVIHLDELGYLDLLQDFAQEVLDLTKRRAEIVVNTVFGSIVKDAQPQHVIYVSRQIEE